ncbi:MAG: zinc finger Ran-binding domain-containing protein [Candidatus Limnocylindrales bacterium]
MEEFWVCPHCRSLNRASAGKCYSCKEKYGSKPKEASSVVANAGIVTPPPPAPAPMADFSAAAAQPPAYISRPVAMPPLAASATGFGAPAARAARGIPNPWSSVKRRIGGSLALRQSVSVVWLGYLTAILMTLLFIDAAIFVLTILPAAADMLQNANLAGAWAHLTSDQQGMARTLAVVGGAIGIVSLLCLSVFLGLTTHNATGLGAEMPILTPYGAGIIWPVVVWTQARIAVGLIVPVALIWLGYQIPGLIAALVAVEIAQRHMDDPFGWFTRPYRHLTDLYAKLGIEGSIESPMVSLWSACFRAANVLAIVAYALPALAVVLVVASDALGRDRIPGWQSSGLGPAQIGVALLVGSLLVWTAGALGLLVPITLGLVRRQRTRKTLVRVGRSRSWVSRPGQGGYTPAQVPTMPDGYDPLDRVIEHYPTYAASRDPSPGLGRPGPVPGPWQGGTGGLVGASREDLVGASDEAEPYEMPGLDQASLNSPSTTSSFPWSEGPSSPAD